MPIFKIKENSKRSLKDILKKLGYEKLAESALGRGKSEKDIQENALRRFIRKNSKYLSFLDLDVEGFYIVSKGISGVIPLEFATNKREYSTLIVEPMVSWDVISKFAAITKYRDWLKVNIEWDTPYTLDIELWYFSLPFLREAHYVLNRPAKGYVKRELEEDFILGNTNWEDFAVNKYPYKKIKFKNTRSEISFDTLPHRLVKWGLEAIEASILDENKVPDEILELINDLKLKLKDVKSEIPTDTKMTKLPRSGAWGGYINLYREIHNLASIAGVIDSESKTGKAYLIETEKLFEYFVDYLLERYSQENGLKFYNDRDDSSRIGLERISPEYYVTMLSSLRPDAVAVQNDLLIVIDAKYKRHFDLIQRKDVKDKEWYNNKFRNDIHQILSYSIFSDKKYKLLLLAYPTYNKDAKINIWRLTRNSRVIVGLIPIFLGNNVSLNLIYKKFKDDIEYAKKSFEFE